MFSKKSAQRYVFFDIYASVLTAKYTKYVVKHILLNLKRTFLMVPTKLYIHKTTYLLRLVVPLNNLINHEKHYYYDGVYTPSRVTVNIGVVPLRPRRTVTMGHLFGDTSPRSSAK